MPTAETARSAASVPPQSGDEIAVPGTVNFRVVAATVGGERMRRRSLFRSDAIDRLGAEGRAVLGELGITTIIDLRTDEERAAQPDDVRGTDVRDLHIPILSGTVSAIDVAQLDLATVYRAMIDQAGDALGEAIRAIADADGGVLVHCTAGKDRTGVVVALTLAAVGVNLDQIAADFARSEQRLAGPWAEAMLGRAVAHGLPLSDGVRELMTASPEPVLRDLFAHIDAEYGSVAGYLDRVGVDAGIRRRLATRLLTRDSR